MNGADVTESDRQAPSKVRARATLVAFAATSIAIDAASKAWASARLPDAPISLGPVTLRLVHNRGVAFGLGGFLPPTALIALTAAVATGIAVLAWRRTLTPPSAGGLIVGGAVANVIDRVTGDSVVDFIDIGRWPVFNGADVILLAGIAVAICGRPRARPHASTAQRTESANDVAVVEPS